MHVYIRTYIHTYVRMYVRTGRFAVANGAEGAHKGNQAPQYLRQRNATGQVPLEKLVYVLQCCCSVCCGVLWCVAVCVAVCCSVCWEARKSRSCFATHCNTLQHTATHCNTLQQTLQQHGNEATQFLRPKNTAGQAHLQKSILNMCCSVVAVCVAVCCSVWQCVMRNPQYMLQCCCSVCCSVLQCVAVL